jgi:hypothetical protein
MLQMPEDEPIPREESKGVPVLDYHPAALPQSGRGRLAVAMEVLGVLAALFAAFAVLLTIEMLFLIVVDLFTSHVMMQGELAYPVFAAISAAALIGVSVYANRLSARLPQ